MHERTGGSFSRLLASRLPDPRDFYRSANHPLGHRTLKFATAFSTVMLSLSVLLVLAGFIVKTPEYHFSFRDDFHVGVLSRGLDSQIVFFNEADYGPYRGSIIGLVDADGNIYPPLEREVSFGDLWGIYYRRFQWPGSTLWTLAVSLWCPVALFAIMPFLVVVCSAVRRRSPNLAEQ